MAISDTEPTAALAKQTPSSDYAPLERDLRQQVRGEVRFDNTSRALYASDGSNYRQTPIGIVLPRNADDVIATLKLCEKYRAPVLARGAGTSLCGQSCNVAVVLDFSKYMNRILELDPETRTAWVEPGVVLDDLRAEANAHGLTFAPDPSTHNHNTLGGMLGNNSCGPHSVMGGRTSDNVLEMEVLTADGARFTVGATDAEAFEKILAAGGRKAEIYRGLRELCDRHEHSIRSRFPTIPRRVSGFNLPELLPENGFHVARALVGSEGTCVIILRARVRLLPNPPARVLVALGYRDVFHAGDHVPSVMRYGPIAVEAVDDQLVKEIKVLDLHPHSVEMLPEGKGWLLAEFGGETEEYARANAQALTEALRELDDAPSFKVFSKEEQEANIWAVRKSALGVTAHVPHEDITWEGWEDSAVAPENLGAYLRDLKSLFEKYGYRGDLYGHFGQGCVHTRINFNLRTAEGIATYKKFMDEASSLVLEHGGSLSGEHGDGQSKAQFLKKMYGTELVRAFEEFKGLWDPAWRLNPGKVVQPYAIDENLRLGTDFQKQKLETWFRYPNDNNDFDRAMLRCVGVGECRKHDSGTMCPSYMATGEEKHSTRGRARLLFEMLHGDLVDGAWRDEGVKDALDLCLSCKGCLSECPVNVDMATYKAEFLAHYYQHHRLPWVHRGVGNIEKWLKLAARTPRLANFFAQTQPFSTLVKTVAGFARQRPLPRIANTTFRQSFFARHGAISPAGDNAVVLWADTFNNYFYPQTALAAVEVLEAAGFQVHVFEENLCCGRPLYEFGLLDAARAKLNRLTEKLRPWVDAGRKVVVLEPSCASVFHLESLKLADDQQTAQKLAEHTFLFEKFLMEFAPGLLEVARSEKALVHGHCHQKAMFGMDADVALLKRAGIEAEVLDAGCCGMAGSFGFEKQKYEVSQRVGERVLFPHLRARPESTVIANGFSCREQIAHFTGRRTEHIAETIRRIMETQNLQNQQKQRRES